MYLYIIWNRVRPISGGICHFLGILKTIKMANVAFFCKEYTLASIFIPKDLNFKVMRGHNNGQNHKMCHIYFNFGSM